MNIMGESANISEQHYTSMDDGNTDKSDTDINTSETTTVDKDIGSNNKGDDKTNNNTWSKDNPVIKTSSFGENTGLKIVVPENRNPVSFVTKFWFQINS